MRSTSIWNKYEEIPNNEKWIDVMYTSDMCSWSGNICLQFQTNKMRLMISRGQAFLILDLLP